MKILFASDLHGSASACKGVLERFSREAAHRLVLLGDLLYHGPRNDFPDCYDPKTVFALLNSCLPAPLCVRGNCDSEVDQLVLNFHIMADYTLLPLEGTCCAFLTHGHLFHISNPPSHQSGDVLIHGHTHLHCIEYQQDYVYLNPGSVALPKEGQPPSYMTYENGLFTIKSMDGKALLEYRM